MPDITITLSGAAATRVQDALTTRLRLPAPATIADAKEYLIMSLKSLVQDVEQSAAEDAIVPGPEPTIT